MTAGADRLQITGTYDPAFRADGRRILADRLWRRGLKKPTAAIDDGHKDTTTPWFWRPRFDGA